MIKTFAILLSAFFAVAGCSRGQTTSATSTESTAANNAAAIAASSQTSEDGQASPDAATSGGHVQTTGAVTVSQDFNVSPCSVSEAGDGLMGGYEMSNQTKEGDPTFMIVRVPKYVKDGTYSEVAGAQAKTGVSNPTSTALQLMLVATGAHEATAITATSKSTTSTVISDGGAKGEMKFSNFQNLQDAIMQSAEAQSKSSKATDPADYALISGTITWTCPKVDRLNGAVNGMVNGMFKGLTSSPTPAP